MNKNLDLPKNVYLKSNSYYYAIRPIGEKNKKWTKLCSTKDGLAGVYSALSSFLKKEATTQVTLSELLERYINDEFIPRNNKATVEKTNKALAEIVYKVNFIKKNIGENFVSDITASEMSDFLEDAFMPSVRPNLTTSELNKAKLLDKPNSFNKYKTFLRTVFKYAEKKDCRPIGSNPMSPINDQKEKPRSRYVTDSEIRRIKQAFCRNDDGSRSRIGLTMSCLIDMAYLTGQRQEDIRTLTWKDVTSEGIQFKPSKTSETTGARILIEMTPKLEEVFNRLKSSKETHITHVFTNSKLQPLTAGNCTNIWRLAMIKCTARGTLPTTNRPQFRDLRRKALTDVARSANRGKADSQAMGNHANIGQTMDYINAPDIFITQRTKATR